MTDDRAALLVADVERRPEALARLLDAYGREGGPLAALPRPVRVRRIVLSGLGSSRYAALAVAPLLRAAGIDTWVEIAGTSRPAPPSPETLFVGISASGGTPETVAAAERHRGTSMVVAVTERPERDLGAVADVVLPLIAGPEPSGVASLTYSSTVAVLLLLAGRLAGEADPAVPLRPAAEAADAVLRATRDHLAAAAELLGTGEPVHVLADAARLGAAEQGALMLRECPRLPAAAFDTGEWLHTAIYTALPGSRALLSTGSPADREVIRTIHGRGGATVVVGSPDGVAGAGEGVGLTIPLPSAALADDRVRLLAEPGVAELLAAELWGRAAGVDVTPFPGETS